MKTDKAIRSFALPKWVLRHGVHRGTLISRDMGSPQEFDTEEAARKAYSEQRAFYHSIGYQIWFAYLKSPDGKETCLETNSYY